MTLRPIQSLCWQAVKPNKPHQLPEMIGQFFCEGMCLVKKEKNYKKSY